MNSFNKIEAAIFLMQTMLPEDFPFSQNYLSRDLAQPLKAYFT